MANPTRPSLRSSTERLGKSSDSPAKAPSQTQDPSLLTRRSSKVAQLKTELPSKRIPSHPSLKPATLARTNSRKRPATAIADATADTRPPTKVTVTQPHGDLVRITNGVTATLAVGEDDLPSGVSTPKSVGAAARLAVPVAGPSTGTQTQDKRSLRSHDGGSRLKSDLSIYFANFDDIIAGVATPPDFLELETPIYLTDEPLKSTYKRDAASPESWRKSASPNRTRKPRALTPNRKASITSLLPSQSSTAYQTLDYSSVARHVRHDKGEDPLADSAYFTQHRRAERKEKQLRNIEKERAMHEKVQLERILDGLQGPDWLKVMGITGVTDGERRDWEPKRDYFVKEVELLVDKFRIWKEEERRLRAEKEAALAAQEDEDEEDDSAESDEAEVNGAEPYTLEDRGKEAPIPKPRRPPRPHGYFLPILPPEPQQPFTSFYAKPHLRAAALGKHRHGRNASAFGHTIPDFEEHEFCPPEELITTEALRDHARKRRRQKRESGAPKA